jgi:DNA-binding SARP family transcriptional activator
LQLGRKRGQSEYPGWHAQAIARLFAVALEEEIEVPYVQDVIRKRWLPLEPTIRPVNWPWPVKIFTLGQFKILVDDKPLKESRKAPHRLLDILKTIIALGIHDVEITQILDAIWPEAEADRAQENFEKGIRRLRRLLRYEQAILIKQGRVSLNPELCWVDAEAFERLAREGEHARPSGKGDMGLICDQKAMDLYRGPFLWQGREKEPWSELLRDRLRSRLTLTVNRLADYWQAKDQADKALDCLQKGVDLDPLAEPLYSRLMKGLSESGRQTEARAIYRRCQLSLMKMEGREPSPETQKLSKQLLDKG